MEIYFYEVNIYKNPSKYSCIRKSCFKKTIKEVLKQNDKYMVLDDYYFTRLHLSKEKYSIYDVLDKEFFSYRTNNHILGDGIFYRLYSVKKWKPIVIRNHIEKFINSQIGYFTNVDLSFIK